MIEILLVSLGSTAGLRAADDELAASLVRAGAAVTLARPAPPHSVRTLALTDFAWARAAHAAASAAIARRRPDAVIYSTITAALLAPLPGAIRFDSLAAANRPGRHGVWQRPRERRVLPRATLLIPWSEGSLAGAAVPRARVVVVPVAVSPSGPPAERDIAAITYGANPEKKGLDRVLAAWDRVRRPGEELLVAGVPALRSRAGVRSVGMLPPVEYRAYLRRARVYLAAPRREDYGIAQLEALADGCVLVTTPAPGPYEALELARALDPRLVTEDLPAAIRAALDTPQAHYATAALTALERLSPGAVDRVVASALLPALASGA
ncbi:MAG TPA: glycosyltransferase [Solirubrobacteraceae bacterium]|nr:glycosyltransferase [Solirubrobacteraceae bacterium]